VGRHAEKLENSVYESAEGAVKVVQVRDLILFTGRVSYRILVIDISWIIGRSISENMQSQVLLKMKRMIRA
jgi:hypothetical protein